MSKGIDRTCAIERQPKCHADAKQKIRKYEIGEMPAMPIGVLQRNVGKFPCTWAGHENHPGHGKATQRVQLAHSSRGTGQRRLLLAFSVSAIISLGWSQFSGAPIFPAHGGDGLRVMANNATSAMGWEAAARSCTRTRQICAPNPAIRAPTKSA